MLTAVEGYYNGTQIVIDERVTLRKGQRVILTILDSLSEPNVKSVNLKKYMDRGEKMFHGTVDEYVKGLRSDNMMKSNA